MAEAMLDVFARRKDRFRMLEEGTYAAGWRGGELKLLEVGCAAGDAAAHLVSTLPVTVTGVDQDPELIARAAEKYAALSERCRFLCCRRPWARRSGTGASTGPTARRRSR